MLASYGHLTGKYNLTYENGGASAIPHPQKTMHHWDVVGSCDITSASCDKSYNAFVSTMRVLRHWFLRDAPYNFFTSSFNLNRRGGANRNAMCAGPTSFRVS